MDALLAAARRGDEHAWRVIVERYARRVYALARSRCRRPDLAEEITQSVFATIAAKLPAGQYTEQGRFESWLFRIVINRIRDEMRRARVRADAVDPAMLSARQAQTPESTANDLDLGSELARLRAALEALSESDREVIELRHHAGLTFRQMADLLNEPLGTLLARHHRALKKLRQLMEATERPREPDHERT